MENNSIESLKSRSTVEEVVDQNNPPKQSRLEKQRVSKHSVSVPFPMLFLVTVMAIVCTVYLDRKAQVFTQASKNPNSTVLWHSLAR